jgi:hypothetical protein
MVWRRSSRALLSFFSSGFELTAASMKNGSGIEELEGPAWRDEIIASGCEKGAAVKFGARSGTVSASAVIGIVGSNIGRSTIVFRK